MSDMDPIVGNWYRDLESQGCFEVVAFDEDARTVEIQYQEGEVEEIELDAWYDMVLEGIDTPDDWNGAFDDLNGEDLGYSDADTRRSREDPLGEVD
ncbi:DUF6763 family protein [Plasticicumulans acidivorans]|uniref:Uncharacterized protein n=1 Tax=Plasticicumulans acidivorans TaxID=886464 RepID=A0A317N0E5_9GAMM|nr:DUF6763 family protein [Plasticicumulans acidivorans]PWV65937.1 hypothetical protein C7443_101423 [Plasticicumulans acidivorans]